MGRRLLTLSRAFAPIFEAAAKRHPDVTWAEVDTEAEPELVGALEIRSIPTLMVFNDGVLVDDGADDTATRHHRYRYDGR